MEITAIIGAVSGVASLVGIVYMLGYWKGQVDSQLREFRKYPPAETALMTRTLWDIYVVDALRNRPDLAEHGSRFQLKKEGEDLIPQHLKEALDQISFNPPKEEIATGYLVVKYLGMEPISEMAEANKLSVQEAIAILSAYLDGKNRTS